MMGGNENLLDESIIMYGGETSNAKRRGRPRKNLHKRETDTQNFMVQSTQEYQSVPKKTITYNKQHTPRTNGYSSKMVPLQYQPLMTDLSNIEFQDIRRSIEIVKLVFPECISEKLTNEMYLILFNKFRLHEHIPALPQPLEMLDKPQYTVISEPEQFMKAPKVVKQHKKSKISKFIFPQANEIEIGSINGDFNYQSQEPEKPKQPELFRPLIDQFSRSVVSSKRVGKERKKIDEIWTSQMQKQFFELYRSGQSIGSIRDRFASRDQRFGKSSYFYEHYRSKLYRALRRSLKMVIKYIAVRDDEHFPEMVPITEARTNFIYYYKEGQPCRDHLLDVYMMKEYDRGVIVRAIETINQQVGGLNEEEMDRLGSYKRRKQLEESTTRSIANEIKFEVSETFGHEDIYMDEE